MSDLPAPIIPSAVEGASPKRSLAEIALQELARRRERALEAVAARQATLARAEAALRPWAAIAAWFHADVRPLLLAARADLPGLSPAHGEPVEPPSWIDFCAPAERADAALRRLAEEVRRAARAALARHEARDPDLHARAAGLLALAAHLSLAAGLPPLILSPSKDPLDLSAPRQRAAA